MDQKKDCFVAEVVTAYNQKARLENTFFQQANSSKFQLFSDR